MFPAVDMVNGKPVQIPVPAKKGKIETCWQTVRSASRARAPIPTL